MTDIEYHIRERAYHLWIESGRDGAADAHWLAEREVLTAFAKTAPAKTTAAKKARKAPAAKQRRAA